MSRDGIVFRDVSRTYRSAAGSVEAVHVGGASFSPGTIAALVGPSGSGKSTLLRILGGLDAADTGELSVGGVDVGALRGRALRRYRAGTVAYVAQRAAANLVPHLAVREQLGPGGADLAESLGLAALLDRRASALSGGEQARAALAAGLSRHTPFVLLDEPTAEVDRGASTLVIDALRDAAAAGRTIVVATHDPQLVALADESLELAVHTDVSDRVQRDPPSEEVVMAVERMTKKYAGSAVVDGATLDVRRGELSVLLGRSGSGKSTLLMVAGGWLRPDEGAVHVPGAGWDETAYLAQRFGLLPELSIAENVALPFRLARRADEGRVAEVLQRLGLEALADRRPAETSIGQQQRAALARALVVQPAALLADEPTSHQDAGSAARVWDALVAACARGTACLVATHDDAATMHADRVWQIDGGRIAS